MKIFCVDSYYYVLANNEDEAKELLKGIGYSDYDLEEVMVEEVKAIDKRGFWTPKEFLKKEELEKVRKFSLINGEEMGWISYKDYIELRNIKEPEIIACTLD